MRFADAKFRRHAGTYLFQCSLATVSVLIVLITLDAVLQTAIIASIGASSFIVFTAPNAFSAKTRSLIGGYAAGIVSGIGCSLLAGVIGTQGGAGWSTTVIIMGALSVGLSIFIMAVTDTEHPPAAGIALAFVLNTWNFTTVIVVITAPLLLSLMKYFFRNHIRDLI